MSASLVGSEMCIRDRGGSSVPPARRGGAGEAHDARKLRRKQRQREKETLCLLYTSDAADDM
eukprot:256083-Alexandrium_andersonii.AAC.1